MDNGDKNGIVETGTPERCDALWGCYELYIHDRLEGTGELDGESGIRVQRHLASCPECRAMLESEIEFRRAVNRKLRMDDDDPAVIEYVAPVVRTRKRWPVFRSLAIAASVLVVAGAGTGVFVAINDGGRDNGDQAGQVVQAGAVEPARVDQSGFPSQEKEILRNMIRARSNRELNLVPVANDDDAVCECNCRQGDDEAGCLKECLEERNHVQE